MVQFRSEQWFNINRNKWFSLYRNNHAKKVFECADNIIDFHIGFSAFMKQGCDLLIPAMQKYMENTISFELSILSPEGYELVQNDLEGIAANLFDPLYMILQE